MDFTPDKITSKDFTICVMFCITEPKSSPVPELPLSPSAALGSAFHATADKLQKNNDYFDGFADNLADKLDEVSYCNPEIGCKFPFTFKVTDTRYRQPTSLAKFCWRYIQIFLRYRSKKLLAYRNPLFENFSIPLSGTT